MHVRSRNRSWTRTRSKSKALTLCLSSFCAAYNLVGELWPQLDWCFLLLSIQHFSSLLDRPRRAGLHPEGLAYTLLYNGLQRCPYCSRDMSLLTYRGVPTDLFFYLYILAYSGDRTGLQTFIYWPTGCPNWPTDLYMLTNRSVPTGLKRCPY